VSLHCYYFYTLVTKVTCFCSLTYYFLLIVFTILGWLESINVLKIIGWLDCIFLKETWCSAFCKDVFSGGILSSQRSKSTNASLSKRSNATCGLFEFYNTFWDVMTDLKIVKKDENMKNKDALLEIYLPHVSLLQHATKLFE